MKFMAGENGRNPGKNLPILRFVYQETYMERPTRELGTPAVKNERLTACSMGPLNTIILQNRIPKKSKYNNEILTYGRA